MKTFLKVIGAIVGLFIILIIIGALYSDSDDFKEQLQTRRISTSLDKKWEKAKTNVVLEDYRSATLLLKNIVSDTTFTPYTDSAKTMLDTIQQLWLADSLASLKEMEMEGAKYKNMFRIQKDEFSENVFYEHKSSPKYNNRDGIKVYIGKKGGQAWLRCKLQYEDDDWLFMDNWIFKADDTTYNLTAVANVERDNDGGRIWEWYDFAPDASMITFLKTFGDAKETKIRFAGRQYHNDMVISSGQRQAVKETLEAYYFMTKHPEYNF